MTLNDTQTMDDVLDSCANEPIRIPGAIQPHGVLLTLLETDWTVQQVSGNAWHMLGIASDVRPGDALARWVGQAQADALRDAAQDADLASLDPLPLQFGGQAFDGLLHRHDGLLFLELEPVATQASADGLGPRLTRTLRRLQSARLLDDLYAISVSEIRALTGYDRVLIYRFQEEGHGQVIAESATADLDAYLGLFFPATDIPQQARELYRLNWLRIIPDAAYVPAPLLPALRPDTGEPLDMSHAVLRSVSPIHCQYMHNMGIRSSMSISLLKDDRLWGLISCGNREPLQVPHTLRAACQTIGQVLSMQISLLEDQHIQRERLAKHHMLDRLSRAMNEASEDVYNSLLEHSQALLTLVDASGVAVTSTVRCS